MKILKLLLIIIFFAIKFSIVDAKQNKQEFKFVYTINTSKQTAVYNYIQSQAGQPTLKINNKLIWHRLSTIKQSKYDILLITLQGNIITIEWHNDKDLNVNRIVNKLQDIGNNIKQLSKV